MCGIVGLITTNSLAHMANKRSFMEQALFVGTMRGKDGTGMFGVRRPKWCKQNEIPETNMEAHWIRAATTGPEFVQDKNVRSMLGQMDTYMAVIGHNRAATLGSAIMENTHPFVDGPITLVHNGTLSNHEDLPKSGKGVGFNVDSHAIAHALATESAEEVVSQLDGAFALVWHDSRDGTVNIIRNSRRPLHFGVMHANDTILIASEVEMLRWLSSRNSLTIANYVQPDPGVLFTWKVDAKSCTPATRRLKMHIPTYTGRVSGYEGGYYGNARYSEWASLGNVKTTSVVDCEDEGDSDAADAPVGAQGATSIPALGNDNKIHEPVRSHRVGGKFPIPMIELLADEGLAPGDLMLFTTSASIPKLIKGGRMASRVLGTVGDAAVKASVYNVPLSRMILGTTQYWTVHPVGIRCLPKNEVEVICEPVSYNTDPAMFVPDYEYVDDAFFLYEGVDDADVGEDTETEMGMCARLVDGVAPKDVAGYAADLSIRGPYETQISKGRWLELTSAGCEMCDSHIPIQDAPLIIWSVFGGSPVPVCVGCIEEGTYAKASARMRV